MKKILTIFSVILFCCSLQGQVLSSSSGYIKPVVAAAGCVGNMVSNGEFTDGTGWTANTGWSIGSGVATYDDLTDGAKLIQTAANMVTNVVANHDYTLSFDITGGTAYLNVISSDDNAGYIDFASYAPGHYSIDFRTPGWVSAGGLGLNVDRSATTAPFNIDNICLVSR